MNEVVVNKALFLWDMSGATATLAAERENSVYRVDHNGERFALRLHRVGYRSDVELRSELDWMHELACNGLPLPAPVPAIDGQFCHAIEGINVDVLSWLTGETMGKKNKLAPMASPAEAYRNLGRSMARLHTVSDGWELPQGFSRPSWNLDGFVGEEPLWGRFWENPTLPDRQAERYLAFRGHAEKVLNELDGQLDYGLVHADLVPENVLIDGEDIQLIDFDDGGFGYRLFDLATTLNWSNRTGAYEEYRTAFVDGYLSERKIDLTHLPLFQALRALTYVGWIVPRFSEPEAKTRNERYIREADFWIDRYYANG